MARVVKPGLVRMLGRKLGRRIHRSIAGPGNGGAGGGGGAPNLLSVTVTALGGLTAHLAAMPATVNAGDLLLLDFSYYNGTSPSITTPAGWSLMANASEFGSGVYNGTRMFYKTAAGTEGGTTVDVVTSNNTKAVAHVYRVQAGTFHAATPPEVATYHSASGLPPTVTTAPDPPSLTPSWGAAFNLWLVKAFHYDASVTTTTYPYAGNNLTTVQGPSQGAVLATCTTTANAASLDPAAFALSGAADWGAHTVAIRPA